MPDPPVPDPTPTEAEHDTSARRVVMIGPVTWDHIDGERRPGGPVSFAARTAEAFGIRLQLVVLAGADADLEALDGHDLTIVEGAHTLAMAHDVADGDRRIRVPVTVERVVAGDNVPDDWYGCSDLVLAPLLPDELDAPSIVDAVAADRLWVLAQGFQRVRAGDGAISFLDRPAEVLDDLGGASTSIFLSSDETAPWDEGALEGLARRNERVVLTRGVAGAEIWRGDDRQPIAPSPGHPVDTTGAGDVFATAFMLALDGADTDEAAAGRLAAGFATAAVERPGPASLPPRAEIEARLRAQASEGASASARGPT